MSQIPKQINIQMLQIWEQSSGRYGYRRSLRAKNITINHKTVQKLMKELKLKCLVRIKKYKSYRENIT